VTASRSIDGTGWR